MDWNYSVAGIDDALFVRGEVPMTKSEVRAVTLSKLKLKRDSSVLDIGCGTGSVSVECALLSKEGFVRALDCCEEAVELTKSNASQFQVNNIEVILGKAPEALPNKQFDRIFLGGGSKEVEPIIEYAFEHLEDHGIFVANTILLNSTYKILEELENKGFENIECVQISGSRGKQKPGWMMIAFNPIYIISAVKKRR